MTYGRSSHQAEALIGGLRLPMSLNMPVQVGKPVVIERLDFKQKKAQLEGESRRYSRMLSSVSATARSRPISSPAATGME